MFYSGVVRELSHKTTAVTHSKEICNHLSEIHNIEMFSLHVEDIGFDMFYVFEDFFVYPGKNI